MRRVAKTADSVNVQKAGDGVLVSSTDGAREHSNGIGGRAITGLDVPKDPPMTKAMFEAMDWERSSHDQETVTATWGKELISPKPFNTYEVGPFVATTAVRPGESHAQAIHRLMGELEAVAAEGRARKREAFMRALKDGT